MCAKLNLTKLFKPSFVEKFGYVSLDLATKFQARTRGCPLPTPYPSFLSLPLLPFHHPIPFPALPSPPHSPPKIEFGAFQPENLTSGGNKFNECTQHPARRGACKGTSRECPGPRGGCPGPRGGCVWIKVCLAQAIIATQPSLV